MKPRRMSEAALMSPNTDILTTPKPETGGGLKTPKFREFSEALSALRSPRDIVEASLNTPLALTTPLPAHAQDLSTPTLTTPRTADWGLFSPIALGSNCSSPRESLSSRDNRPADLPLDSSIGLSSPHDGILAKRRKLKNLSSSHSRSVESDSNSCDTPTQEAGPGSSDCPRDLTKKTCDRDLKAQSPSSTTDVDTVRDRVGDVRISSPKWFKHPKHLDRLNLSSKELLSDIPSSYHPSPLAVPSPNWTAIKELLCSNTQTPKVLDNFVFDVLPPNTPLTPTAKTALASSCRERSPEPLNYEAKHKPACGEPQELQRPHKVNGGQRVTFADCPPRPGSLTPPPPCPQDLSMRKEGSTDLQAPPHPMMVQPKTEYDPGPPVTSHYTRGHSPPPYPVKEEPREAPPGLPPGFPPYYLPDLAPHHLYRQSGDHQHPRLAAPTSPPASPPRSHPPPAPASNHYGGGTPGQPRPQFYGGLSLSSLYEGHGGHGGHPQYNMWNGGSAHHGGHDMGHVTMPTPWGRVTSEAGHNNHVTSNNGLANIQNHFNNLKPCLDLKNHVKSEHRLSTESQDSVKKKARKMKPGEVSDLGGGGDHQDPEGQPPKKKGKGKGKVNKDPNAPKRVFVCPHCNVSFILSISSWQISKLFRKSTLALKKNLGKKNFTFTRLI